MRCSSSLVDTLQYAATRSWRRVDRSFAVSDRDGNPASVSAAYTVDTVHPALRLTRPDSHRIVDAAAIEVAGVVTDAVSGVASVTVGGVEADVMDGSFHRLVPLEIGINEITVTAADAAGLTAGESFRVLRLVTDRSREDAERVRELEIGRDPEWEFDVLESF